MGNHGGLAQMNSVSNCKHNIVPPKAFHSQGVNVTTVAWRLELASIGAIEGNGFNLKVISRNM